MPATPTIRDAGAADLPAITAIYADEVLHGTASYETVPPGAVQMRQRLDAVVSAGYPWRVATVGDDVAGYAYASAYRTRAGYRWTVEDSVYVAAGFRGAGLGRALLADLIDRCTAAGFRQMVAVIGDGSNLASVRLHEGLGFHVAARFPGLGWKHGRWLENVQMLRALGAGSSTPPAELPLHA